ncbi:superoxide dismutase family protein [Mycobacterium sp. TY814]|uniref:superoxide dismutase family protein n=1 Tax=unclassified Mycobacterium TaxID=2642494 RepID=UPI002741D08E|nr:superoxide dismutase family protein [Mycobacterium sp. TY814]MDP7722234.1 superoxide dismutase family protein [Mycobacterium sp. TY814]
MKKGVTLAVAALATTIAPLAACSTQQGGSTSSSSGGQSGAEKLSTQLKGADGSQIATATFDFASGYATVTVEAGPNSVLTPGFHGLAVHSVGSCEPSAFESAGGVYQASGHTGYPASGRLTALQVRPDGSAKLVTTTSGFTAADLRNSSGTSLVISSEPGTFGEPSADETGKRLACGVIAAASSTTTSSTTSSTATTTSVTTVTTTTAVVPPATTSTSTSTVTVTGTPTTTSTAPKTVTTPPGG